MFQYEFCTHAFDDIESQSRGLSKMFEYYIVASA